MSPRKTAEPKPPAGAPDPEQARFDALAAELVDGALVSRAKMFGAPGLRVGTKFFAMLHRGSLVVKLPQEQVAAQVAAGRGSHGVHLFEPMPGRTMKEWLVISAEDGQDWLPLALEARDFVASLGRG